MRLHVQVVKVATVLQMQSVTVTIVQRILKPNLALNKSNNIISWTEQFSLVGQAQSSLGKTIPTAPSCRCWIAGADQKEWAVLESCVPSQLQSNFPGDRNAKSCSCLNGVLPQPGPAPVHYH